MDNELIASTQIDDELQCLRTRVVDLEQLAGEHQKIYTRLTDNEEKYRHISNHAQSSYALYEILTDLEGNPIDARLLEVNQAFEDLLERDALQILGRRLSEILPESDFQSLLETGGQVALTEEPMRFEHFASGLDRYLDISVYSPRSGQIATIVSDITARRRTEEALRLRTVYFKELFESSPLGIILLDNDDLVIECNEGFERLFGYRRDEVQGQRINTLIVRDAQSPEASVLSQKVLLGEVVDAEGVRCHKDGSPIDVRILAHPIHLDNKQIGIYGIYSDISRRKRDSLTRLVNRPTFMERLEMELERAIKDQRLTAVHYLDLEQFKDVNDTYGSNAGDLLLQAVAQRLREMLREGASIARLGADEFGILQMNLDDVGNAAGLARRLVSALDQPFEIEGHNIHVSANVGIAVAPPGGVIGAKQLVGQAERALAQARSEGHKNFKFHATHMDQEVQARMLLGQELHRAIERDELYLMYQPQIALPHRRIVGVEALLRWNHPKGDKVGPDRFVPVAEASGVIVPIGDWVLRSACAQAAEWQKSHAPGVPVAVNLSAVQFKNPRFADSVLQALTDAGLPAEYLELELTERILVEATPAVKRTLQRLQEVGVKLTLDDFGKGYSSMDYLRRLPLQKLKIDRSFVKNLDADSSDAAIVSAITVLGNKLGMRVVAEGVERRSQLDMLAAEGCMEIQGYYFSPPVLPEEVSTLMIEGNESICPSMTIH